LRTTARLPEVSTGATKLIAGLVLIVIHAVALDVPLAVSRTWPPPFPTE